MSGEKNMHLLMGNHELMMIEHLDTLVEENGYTKWDMFDTWHLWKRNGGEITRDSLWFLPDDKQKELVDFVRKLPYYFVVNVNGKKFFLSHAGVRVYANCPFWKGVDD